MIETSSQADERRQRIMTLARVAVALLQTGLTKFQVMYWIAQLATQLWTPSPDVVKSYVDAAMNEAVAMLRANHESLFVIDYSETEP